jgi:hypothetical protein
MISESIRKTDFSYVSFSNKRIGKVIVVPNVGGIAREMTGGSQIAIILRKFLALKLVNMFRFGFNNISFLPKLAKMDYAAGVKILCELEILKAKEFNPKIKMFFLHNQMVDMALALNNKMVFNYFFYLSKKYNFIPCIISYNPDHVIKLLSQLNNIPSNLRTVLFLDGRSENKESINNYLKISSLDFSILK